MKKFAFRMQRVLDVKIKKEDLLKQELGRLLQRKQAYEEVKKYFIDQMQEEFSKIRENKTFCSEDQIMEENYILGLRNDIYKQELMIKDYENKIDKKRAEILENRREIKSLEKLKDKQKEQYMYDVMLDERKEMDEVASRKVF
jgi:flagellar FliJ protein